ncbi:nuclear matrix constituent protein 1-like protein-like [Dorcoceras hygrometricum]|uniref:Nuclear matrix constituent protein 1-like protein-like n=1 Tax=Dorcoceras hygrometricum TaxID=472368 RepID=A0A2Z7B717_9LAMI|nr:nuclear matrix constituent protein 1-like protein-like [Dorcoceras hygrometricum]
MRDHRPASSAQQRNDCVGQWPAKCDNRACITRGGAPPCDNPWRHRAQSSGRFLCVKQRQPSGHRARRKRPTSAIISATSCAGQGQRCAASAQVARAHARERGAPSHTAAADGHSIGYPRMSASGESSTTMHRLLHASGSHPIPPPNDPKTNQYNQDLGLIHSTNGNHLESPNEGSSIEHQVTIYLHAQNITMFPTNETWLNSFAYVSSGSSVQGEQHCLRKRYHWKFIYSGDSNAYGNDFWRSRCRLSLFVNRRRVPESVVDTEFVPNGFFIEPLQYWGAAPSLIKTWCWARVCIDIIRYSMFGCLRPGVYTDGFVGYFSDSDVQSIPEFDSTSSDGSTVYRYPSPQVESFEEAESVEPIAHLALGPAISGVAQEEQSYFVESPESPPPTCQRQDTSASSSDSPMHFNSDDIPLDDTTDVQPTFPAVTVDHYPLLDDLKISLSQRMDNAQSDILSRLRTIERGLQDTLGQQNEYFRNLIQRAQQDGQNQDDIQTLRFNEFKKVVLAQSVTAGADSVEVRKEIKALDAKINSLDGQTLRFNEFKKVVLAQSVTAGADSVEVRKEIKALDAKINSLDGQVAAIRNEQLEFQTKIAADILSLSTQLGDLVEYIQGGDAKKGEGSSSRRPLPPPVNQGEGSGNRTSGDTIRTTEISQRDIDNARRNILESLMATDRQRERERGSRSRSGSHTRRRY